VEGLGVRIVQHPSTGDLLSSSLVGGGTACLQCSATSLHLYWEVVGGGVSLHWRFVGMFLVRDISPSRESRYSLLSGIHIGEWAFVSIILCHCHGDGLATPISRGAFLEYYNAPVS
jgi:hypothetical protein